MLIDSDNAGLDAEEGAGDSDMFFIISNHHGDEVSEFAVFSGAGFNNANAAVLRQRRRV